MNHGCAQYSLCESVVRGQIMKIKGWASDRIYREIALTKICSIVTAGTFRGSGNVIKTIDIGSSTKAVRGLLVRYLQHLAVIYKMKMWSL